MPIYSELQPKADVPWGRRFWTPYYQHFLPILLFTETLGGQGFTPAFSPYAISLFRGNILVEKDCPRR